MFTMFPGYELKFTAPHYNDAVRLSKGNMMEFEAEFFKASRQLQKFIAPQAVKNELPHTCTQVFSKLSDLPVKLATV